MTDFIYTLHEPSRLDVYLESQMEYTRSQIKKEITEGRVLVNEEKKKAGYQLERGDQIKVTPKPAYRIIPKDLHLEILYEDEDLLVVNKPKGLVVHPGAGREEESLVHGLLFLYKDLPVLDDPLRPGIVHRLDKDTEGLVLVAKNLQTMKALFSEFKNRRVHKTYQCLVHGHLNEEIEVDQPLGRSPRDRKKMAVVTQGRKAYSVFKPLSYHNNKTLVEVEIITGRTHQIRVHAASIGHPILGDQVYSHKPFYGLNAQALCAVSLSFIHPRTRQRVCIQRKAPSYFEKILNK